MAELEFLAGPNEGKRVEIGDGPVVIGRGKEADVTIPDQAASTRHAEFRQEDGRWQVRDLDSSNGVRVNGNRVTSSWLARGDLIVVGNSRFVLHAGTGLEAPAPEEEAPGEAAAEAEAPGGAAAPEAAVPTRKVYPSRPFRCRDNYNTGRRHFFFNEW